MYCGCKMNWEVTLGLPYAISLQHQSKPLPAHCLSSLSATRATTLWLKQPTCFCSVQSKLSILRAVEKHKPSLTLRVALNEGLPRLI